jgi:steroid delta-isomerase-like uncharacterized protein
MRYPTLVLSFLACLACLPEGHGQSRRRNAAAARRYLTQVVNQRNLEALNTIFADSFLVHQLPDSTVTHATLASQRAFLQQLFYAFPDIQYTIGEVLSEGDRVAMRASFRGTQQHAILGYPASGRRIDYVSEIFFFRFEKGKIHESWVQLDWATLDRKLTGK